MFGRKARQIELLEGDVAVLVKELNQAYEDIKSLAHSRKGIVNGLQYDLKQLPQYYGGRYYNVEHVRKTVIDLTG